MPTTFTTTQAAEQFGRYSPEVVAAERATQAAERAALASAAADLGFADVADHVATALTTYRNAERYGLDGYDDRLLASRIRSAIEVYQTALSTPVRSVLVGVA